MYRRATQTLFLLLSCVHYTHGERYQDIDPEKIGLRVNNNSSSIVAMWDNPNDDINSRCYKSNMQFRSKSESGWQNVEIKGFFYSLPDPDWTKDYVFRVRMKYECITRQWSPWTPEIWWKGPSLPPQTLNSETSVGVFVLPILIPMIVFLIYCIFSEKRIRRVFISPVPDPKHTINNLLTIDKSQWWTSIENCCAECMTADVEIVGQDKGDQSDGFDCAALSSNGPATVAPAATSRDHAHLANDFVNPDHTPYVYV